MIERAQRIVRAEREPRQHQFQARNMKEAEDREYAERANTPMKRFSTGELSWFVIERWRLGFSIYGMIEGARLSGDRPGPGYTLRFIGTDKRTVGLWRGTEYVTAAGNVTEEKLEKLRQFAERDAREFLNGEAGRIHDKTTATSEHGRGVGETVRRAECVGETETVERATRGSKEDRAGPAPRRTDTNAVSAYKQRWLDDIEGPDRSERGRDRNGDDDRGPGIPRARRDRR